MQIDGHANNDDLNTLIDDLCDSDDTSFPVAKKVMHINRAYEKLVGEIINADGTWQYDDTNFTDQPRGTGTLVEGQQDYSFASEYLQIEMIEVKLANGSWFKLKPIDHSELGDQSPDEYWGVDSSGNPTKGHTEFFDQQGDTLRLYPAPAAASLTLSAGIRIWFKRKPDLFTTSDTTQEPGLPSSYHHLLSYMASIPYCIKYHRDRVAPYMRIINKDTEGLLNHYAHREKSKVKKITGSSISFR